MRWGDVHEYLLECPEIYRSYCALIALISMKKVLHNFGGDINLLSNLLVKSSKHYMQV